MENIIIIKAQSLWVHRGSFAILIVGYRQKGSLAIHCLYSKCNFIGYLSFKDRCVLVHSF